MFTHDRRRSLQPGGFTLVELLIVIGIITILFAVVLVAVDPARRFGEARNARRFAETASILSAILQYQVDNRGNLPSGIDNKPGSGQVLGTNTTGCNTTCTATRSEVACLDLSSSLVETYFSEIPVDPGSGTTGNTDYFLDKTAGGRLVVGACDPDVSATIQVKR